MSRYTDLRLTSFALTYDMKCFFHLLLLLITALSSNGRHCKGPCNTVALSASLGSSLSLPCNLPRSNETEEARWSHSSSKILLIGPNGNVTFEDPRDGRVTALPYLFDRGDFSILIDGVQDSDMGTYCCQLGHKCQKVEVSVLPSPTGREGLEITWFYILIGAGILILLVISYMLIFRLRHLCKKNTAGSYYINSAFSQNNPRQENGDHNGSMESEDSDDQYVNVDDAGGDYVNIDSSYNVQDNGNEPQGRTGLPDNRMVWKVLPERFKLRSFRSRRSGNATVYENDIHDPNPTACVQTRPQPQKRASRETQSHQPNLRPAYYANQSEIFKHESAVGRSDNQPPVEHQFKNPLYEERTIHQGQK